MSTTAHMGGFSEGKRNYAGNNYGGISSMSGSFVRGPKTKRIRCKACNTKLRILKSYFNQVFPFLYMN